MDPECFNRYRPLGLIFEGPNGAPGDGGGDGNEDNGFPKDTRWQDMKPEEQVNYWRFQSRKHEKTAKEREKFDEYKTDSENLKKLQDQNKNDQEKAVDEARRQGEQTGSTRYLKDAVAGHLRGLTRKSVDDIDEALQFVDINAFLGSDGALDRTQLDKFAKQLDVTPDQEPRRGQSHFDTLARGNGNGTPRTGTSLADKRKATRDSLTPARS